MSDDQALKELQDWRKRLEDRVADLEVAVIRLQTIETLISGRIEQEDRGEHQGK